MRPEQRQRWQELTELLDRADRRGVVALKAEDLKRLARLYRQVTIDLSRARTDGNNAELVRYLNLLAARAHGQVYGARRVDLRPLGAFLTVGFPRLVRARWRPIGFAAMALVVTSLASFAAVVRRPELAYSLFDERIVEFENLRLEKQQGTYRGNFTFDTSSSPLAAAGIITNNVRVAIMEFALGALACVPGLLILVYNGRMLGTLSGLVWNGGYFVDFYGLILTHGVLELSALCVAGGAGLAVGWSLIDPGPRTRSEALRHSAREAFALLGGSMAMLVVAGLIEAYITPHCLAPVRWSVALASAVLLALYFGLAGRGTDKP